MVGWYEIDNSVHISPSMHKLSKFWFLKRPYIICRVRFNYMDTDYEVRHMKS